MTHRASAVLTGTQISIRYVLYEDIINTTGQNDTVFRHKNMLCMCFDKLYGDIMSTSELQSKYLSKRVLQPLTQPLDGA